MFRFYGIVLVGWALLMPLTAGADEVGVACAANFASPMAELKVIYEQRTGSSIVVTFGSTGMLFGQIVQGAPYDLFFAADQARPEKLFRAGNAQSPVTYALGKVVLWSKSPPLKEAVSWQEVVQHAAVKKLGLANPKSAPYGAAAQAAMAGAGLLSGVKSRLVFGKNVGQAFQFAWSEAADASFVALAQALSEKGSQGKHWLIPEAESIVQQACLLNGSGEAAEAFLNFVLHDPEARAITAQYGYE